jgi:hypothetical protein
LEFLSNLEHCSHVVWLLTLYSLIACE